MLIFKIYLIHGVLYLQMMMAREGRREMGGEGQGGVWGCVGDKFF